MIPSGNNSPARAVVSVSVYYSAAGLLVPECIIHPVVSVSVYYFAPGLLFPEGIISETPTTGRMIPSGINSPAAK
jgi:hypothetical protein